MLHFSDLLFIYTLCFYLSCFLYVEEILCCLFDLACRLNTLRSKKGMFIATTPEPTGCNIQPGSIFNVGGRSGKGFTCDWLKVWFNLDIITDFCQQVFCCISDFIVSQNWEATSLTRESVILAPHYMLKE